MAHMRVHEKCPVFLLLYNRQRQVNKFVMTQASDQGPYNYWANVCRR